MKILAFDPGAKRCGWAILGERGADVEYHGSGISGLSAGDNYQKHRLKLIDHWVTYAGALLCGHQPEVVVSEIVPPTGGSIPNIINRQLALSVVTTVQALAFEMGLAVAQISAATVKKRISGRGKATKVQVRNGVLARLPQLESRRPEWTGKTAVFDEVDAIAVALAYLLGA